VISTWGAFWRSIVTTTIRRLTLASVVVLVGSALFPNVCSAIAVDVASCDLFATRTQVANSTKHAASAESSQRGGTYSQSMTGGQARSLFGLSRSLVAPNSVNPRNIRFSQSSVNGADDITASMRANGWQGDAIDVVRMPDGRLTTLDNTRVLAADRAGINVQANIHNFDDALPANFVDRFTTQRGGVPSTFGDAINNRIGNQNRIFRETYPQGSAVTGAR